MNFSHNGSNEALETRNRSRDVAEFRRLHPLHGGLPGQLRRVQVVVPGPRGDLPGSVRRDDRRLRQAVPRRLLASQHPRLRHRRQGHRRGQPRQGHLPCGRHDRGLRAHAPGAHADAGLHRRAGLYRHRPQVLGVVRHRRGYLRHLPGGRRERLRHRPGGRVLQGRADQAVARDGAPDQASTRSGRKSTATSSSS